jgi:hypothetical protein
MFAKKFILYIFFYIQNISITLLHIAFLQYNSITMSVASVILNCSLGAHVHKRDHHLMNELLFHFKELEVIALMSSRSEVCTRKNSITVLIYQLSVYEQSRTKTDKVGLQFSGTTASKKQTFPRSVARWWHECSLEEDMVQIKDIPEPIIKSSYAHMTLRYCLACFQSTPHT